MAYYLYLISHHRKVPPVPILKLLVESLVLSHLNYALAVWGPALAHDLLARLIWLHNCAVQVIEKFDHVSSLRRQLCWLPVSFLIQYHCDVMMFRYYHSKHNNYILLTPPIKFGQQSIYSTRTRSYFAAIDRFRLSFPQRFFHSKGFYW